MTVSNQCTYPLCRRFQPLGNGLKLERETIFLDQVCLDTGLGVKFKRPDVLSLHICLYTITLSKSVYRILPDGDY